MLGLEHKTLGLLGK